MSDKEQITEDIIFPKPKPPTPPQPKPPTPKPKPKPGEKIQLND